MFIYLIFLFSIVSERQPNFVIGKERWGEKSHIHFLTCTKSESTSQGSAECLERKGSIKVPLESNLGKLESLDGEHRLKSIWGPTSYLSGNTTAHSRSSKTPEIKDCLMYLNRRSHTYPS